MKEFRIKETDYYIKKATHGFHLIYLDSVIKEGVNRVTNEPTKSQKTFTKYYGTLYQSLQGFIRCRYEEATSLEDIEVKTKEALDIVGGIMQTIEDADKAIMEAWKIVKVSPN